MSIKGQGHPFTMAQGYFYLIIKTCFSLLSKITRPIEAKFHVEPLWDGGRKVCSNGLSHMTKVAAMLIYNNKNPLKYARTNWPIALKLDMQHGSLVIFCSDNIPGLTLTDFTAKSDSAPLCFYMGKSENNGFFRNYCTLWYQTK